MSESIKVCKFFVEKGSCNKKDCEFAHIENICRFHFRGDCKNGETCKFSHEYKSHNTSDKSHNLSDKSHNLSNNIKSHEKKHKKKLIRKNTETFEPSYIPRDMTVCIGNPKNNTYNRKISTRDVIYVPDLFSDNSNSNDYYNKLLEEIGIATLSGAEEKGVWKLWHGDSHLIADDHLNWKNKCPTFNNIIKKLTEYFGMDVKATRFNWYRDSSEWKPYHHDAAAVDADKAMKQNFTVGVSFGLTRDAAFEHAKTRTTVEFPLTDGSVYCFSKDVNIEWRHGIPQVPPSQYSDKGRISIIAWGWVDQSI